MVERSLRRGRTAGSRGDAENAEDCPWRTDSCAAAHKGMWDCAWRGAVRRRSHLDPQALRVSASPRDPLLPSSRKPRDQAPLQGSRFLDSALRASLGMTAFSALRASLGMTAFSALRAALGMTAFPALRARPGKTMCRGLAGNLVLPLGDRSRGVALGAWAVQNLLARDAGTVMPGRVCSLRPHQGADAHR